MQNFFHSLLSLWLRLNSQAKRPGCVQPLVSTTSEDAISETQRLQVKLRSFLRRFPLWCEGHKALCRLAITQADIKTAYASAQAVRVLERNSVESAILLGMTLVRGGEFSRARTLLQSALEKAPDNLAAKEELIAALLPLGQKEEAQKLYASIPREKRSFELAALAKAMVE
jgi:tetratricopeptide (TPR) repeat protein